LHFLNKGIYNLNVWGTTSETSETGIKDVMKN